MRVFIYSKVPNAPFTLQAVHPAVTGDPGWCNHLPSRPISSELFTLQSMLFMDVCIWQNAPVLQLPFKIHMRPCVTVVKCPCNSTHLMSPYFTVFHILR